MTKRTTSKYKLDRRMGENIWGRNKSPINKRNYGPGQHGQRKSRKLSDYGTQLHAKQKLKGYYGNITERQFRGYYEEASRKTGDTGEMMIGLLERRLDAVVYRAKFVPTPFSARQLVSHGHVSVNGKRVTIPSYLVKEGDLVELRSKAKDMGLVLEATKSPERRAIKKAAFCGLFLYAVWSAMPFSLRNGSSSPCSNISLTMSQPPTNSPFT
jgi:small subunit ribosomal protein S4